MAQTCGPAALPRRPVQTAEPQTFEVTPKFSADSEPMQFGRLIQLSPDELTAERLSTVADGNLHIWVVAAWGMACYAKSAQDDYQARFWVDVRAALEDERRRRMALRL
jgi:hypothetical protein